MKRNGSSPLLLNNEGVSGDIVLRHVILRGWVWSGVSRSARETVGGGGEGGARSRDGSHEHRNGDGRVKAGRRGGGRRLKGEG